MNIYPLYVFDASRHADILPSTVEDVASVARAVSTLREREVGLNPRFERLGWHLARHFPSPPEKLGADATEEEIEAYLDMESFWIGGPPDLQLQRWTDALWTPEILRIDKMPELLSVLLPLARQLRLDVFDEEQGIYLPAMGLPLPEGEGDRYRMSFDRKAYSPTLFSVESLRAFFVERLTLALAGLGFEYRSRTGDDFFFIRNIDGGEQIVRGIFRGRAPALSCEISLISCSDRLAAIKRQFEGPNLVHPRNYSMVFHVFFRRVRELARPAWNTFPFATSSYTTNEEEVDWMVADLLSFGLPILDKARTVEGVDWLFNSEDGAAVFPNNLHSPQSGITDYAHEATIYARLAANPRFDTIVSDVDRRLAGYSETVVNRYKSLTVLCRDSVQPAGGGVA